ATVPAGFKLDLGLPGLPVKINTGITGGLEATIGYDYAFAFGDNAGLFVNTTNTLQAFDGTLPNDQLSLHTVIKPTSDFKVNATVGLLQATLDNSSNMSQVDATFSLNGLGLSGAASVSVAGNANLKLHASASFGNTG